MGKFDDDETYPNQPLSDVACEVRFAGEMQVECERHRFWNRIRSEYPSILVPQIENGQYVALKHYKFQNAEGNRSVAVALNSLAYSDTKYPGHRAFISEFARLAGIFHDTFPDIRQINRIGWRYINVMPFSREDGKVPISRILKFDISLPSAIFQSTKALNFEWTGRCLDGEVILKVQVAVSKDNPGAEALVLDIDFGQDRADIKWKEVGAVVEDGRRKCRGLFEEMITDEYRSYLRGETL